MSATEPDQPTLLADGPKPNADTGQPTMLTNGPTPAADTGQPTLLADGATPAPEVATILVGSEPAPAAAPAPPSTMGGATEEVRAAQRRGLGLARKFFLFAAGLIAATVGSAVAVTAYRADIVADRTVREALAATGGVWRSFRAEREMSLRGTLRTLADEPQTRALLAESVTPDTVKDWAGDKTGAIGAAFLAVLDARGIFIARSDKAAEEATGRSVAHATFVKEALSGKESSAFVREGPRVFTVAAAPVTSGEGDIARLEGVLFAGYPLDGASARALAAVSGTDVTFLASTGRKGEPPRAEAVASTLAEPAAFLEALSASAGAIDKLLGRGEDLRPTDLRPGGDHVIAVAFPLRTGSGDVIGALVASRSLEAAKAAFTQIETTLLIVGLGALMISLPATYYFGRRIARPLVALAASAHAIREGNLNVALPDGGSDEVGVLARSFARMVSELKEKAELERFIADMGFSPQDATPRRSAVSAVTEAGWTGPRRASTEEARLGPGTLLGGRYVVEALLGRGGMASVWRARDRELDEEVALKVLRDDVIASHPRLVAQIKEEIKLGRRITHPNVLRTHDLGDLDGVRFISMELVPGPTLRSMLDRHGALSLPVGLQLGRQICRGLAAAHEAGVIHRDIKPQNIIVAQNGVVKIMDFGIALAQERHDTVGGDGQVAGTPDYMSPEQIEGKRVDARADIYALGVVLYEMFTGVRPFHAETAVQTLMRNLMEQPPPVRTLRPELPEALEALILRTIVKNPEDRTQTAVDLRAALGKISS